MSSVSAQGQDSDYQCLSSVDSTHSHHSDDQYFEDEPMIREAKLCGHVYDCQCYSKYNGKDIVDHNISNVIKTSKESLTMIYRKRLSLLLYGFSRNSSNQTGICTKDIMEIIMLFHSNTANTILYLKCSYIDFEILQCYLSDKANKILNINSYKATYTYDTTVKNVTDCHLSNDQYFIGLLKLDFHHVSRLYRTTFQIEINVLDTHENVIFSCCFNFNLPMIFYRFVDHLYDDYMWDLKQILQISNYQLYRKFGKTDLINASVTFYENSKGFPLLLLLSDTFLWTLYHFLSPNDINTLKICCKQLLMVYSLRQVGLNANKITLDINQWICLLDRMNMFGDIILWHRIFDYILKCDDIKINYDRILIKNGHRTFSERTKSDYINQKEITNKITIMDVKSFVGGPFAYVNAENVQFSTFIQNLREKILTLDPFVDNFPAETSICIFD